MTKLEELKALKNLNMKRLAKLRTSQSNELKLAEDLDMFLTKEIREKGGVAKLEKNLGGIKLKEPKCQVSPGNYAVFVTNKERESELENREMEIKQVDNKLEEITNEENEETEVEYGPPSI